MSRPTLFDDSDLDRPNDLWRAVSNKDGRVWRLKNRHYSTQIRGARWSDVPPSSGTLAGPGKTLTLLTPCGRACFVWLYCDPTMRYDAVDGPLCTIFRNEGAGLSSELICAAEEWTSVVPGWSGLDWWTYVSPTHVRSSNPGYCFKVAGYGFAGRSKRGLMLLRKRNDLCGRGWGGDR